MCECGAEIDCVWCGSCAAHCACFQDEEYEDDDEPEPETCILCGCIVGEEVGVGLRNPDGSGRCWCDVCYKK